jgi:hypothetical protein
VETSSKTQPLWAVYRTALVTAKLLTANAHPCCSCRCLLPLCPLVDADLATALASASSLVIARWSIAAEPKPRGITRQATSNYKPKRNTSCSYRFKQVPQERTSNHARAKGEWRKIKKMACFDTSNRIGVVVSDGVAVVFVTHPVVLSNQLNV